MITNPLSVRQFRGRRGAIGNTLLAALALVLILVGGTAYFLLATPPRLINTEYQAVLLDNGSAYFGRVEKITDDYLVLTEVYYVQSRANPETKQVSNILVKRGKEWHAPDRMLLNRRHVVFLEPVASGSTVAKLIAESRKQ